MRQILPIIAVLILASGFFYLAKSKVLTQTAEETNTPEISGAQTSTTPALAFSSGKTSIVIGGDVMLARWVEQKALSAGGWDKIFENISDTLSAPDCSFVNLESPIKGKKPQTQINSMIFAAKPDSVGALVSAGIDAVTLANNHVTDQGLQGLQETKSILTDNNISYVGAGESSEEALSGATIQCGGVKIGLVGSTYGTNFPADGVSVAGLEDVTETIEKLSNETDYVIVLAHWGSEYNSSPSPYQQEIAHDYVDAGADLVVGSHPHVLQPTETYKGSLIAYSLGNLVFDQASRGKKTEGALLKVELDKKNQNFEIIPIQIKNYFQPTIAEDDTSFKESLGLTELSWSLER